MARKTLIIGLLILSLPLLFLVFYKEKEAPVIPAKPQIFTQDATQPIEVRLKEAAKPDAVSKELRDALLLIQSAKEVRIQLHSSRGYLAKHIDLLLARTPPTAKVIIFGPPIDGGTAGETQSRANIYNPSLAWPREALLIDGATLIELSPQGGLLRPVEPSEHNTNPTFFLLGN